MNWDIIKGKWKEMKGEVRKQWGKLTDEDFQQIAGEKDKLVGRLQQRYEAERSAEEYFQKSS